MHFFELKIITTHSSQFTSEADMEQQKGDKNNDSDDNQDLSDHTPYLEDKKHQTIG